MPGDPRPPIAKVRACGGSSQPSRPAITLQSRTIEGSAKSGHWFCHENKGWNDFPGSNITLDGGQGRSPRLKDCGVPLLSNVDSWFGAKDAVEVACIAKIEPQPLLMVMEKNKAYALGDMLVINQHIGLTKANGRITGLIQREW